MAVTIITKNGSGEPLGGVLVRGELAVDVDGGALYTSSDGTDIVPLGGDLGGEPAGSFLRSNVSDNYETGTLTFNQGTSVALENIAAITYTSTNITTDMVVGVDWRLQLNGADRCVLYSTGALELNQAQFLGPAGVVGDPTYSFSTDDDTGMYRGGTNIIAFATGGIQRATINATGDFTVTSGNIKAGDGSATAPAWSFNSDSNTGIYRQGSDSLSVTCGGQERTRTNTAGFQVSSGDVFVPTGRLFAENGTAAAPTYSFSNDNDLGVYRVGTNTLGFSTGGALRSQIGSTGEITGGLFSGTGVTTASSKFEVVATHPGAGADANTIYFVTG